MENWRTWDGRQEKQEWKTGEAGMEGRRGTDRQKGRDGRQGRLRWKTGEALMEDRRCRDRRQERSG